MDIDGDWRGTVGKLEEIEKELFPGTLASCFDEAGEARTVEYVPIRAAQSEVESGNENLVDWKKVALTILYRRKRAKNPLADLVRARGRLRELGFGSDEASIDAALGDEGGVRAIEIALRRIKQQVVASSVMELITCGAVPPYRDVLGGKLVAILMASGQVVSDFKEKYQNRTSLIASALAGRPIRRPPRLALITTSSLYPLGSSQYNRISVPTPRGGQLHIVALG